MFERFLFISLDVEEIFLLASVSKSLGALIARNIL